MVFRSKRIRHKVKSECCLKNKKHPALKQTWHFKKTPFKTRLSPRGLKDRNGKARVKVPMKSVPQAWGGMKGRNNVMEFFQIGVFDDRNGFGSIAIFQTAMTWCNSTGP